MAVGADPPFQRSPAVRLLGAEIVRLVGRYEGLAAPPPQPRLRRANQVRTILGTAALEGNTTTAAQATAILEGRRVLGPRRELLEIENVAAAYAEAATFSPDRVADLLRVHGVLMRGLAPDAGRLRHGAVGILRGARVVHVAPPADRLRELLTRLCAFVRRERAIDPLVTSAVAHYELEFIHPFSDGNGRLGRLWQHVILRAWHPVFAYLPVESLVHARQRAYYQVLRACDRAGDSTRFVEFSLTTIRDALVEFLGALRPARATAADRLARAREALGAAWFTRRAYLALTPTLSTATASRDLAAAVTAGVLVRTGETARARYRFRARR